MNNPTPFHTHKTSFQRHFGRVPFYMAKLTGYFFLIAIMGIAAFILFFANSHTIGWFPFLRTTFVIWAIWVGVVLAKALILTIRDGIQALTRGTGER